ncbi:transcriptional regulator [Zhengella mangrovi]|uniref:Transcriptional regulator n=1 Tax=Zhengella mangrovi TaxID=1982044 RepID=A0A2G1QUK8_9HYPH|nr:GntR family transcriptional regulator [Zhengella mangrovi]PHP69150.1 transcriptional regulator [Zhengella mangrovi]
MSEGRVEALYQRLKEMAVNFGIRPGERINEVQLARDLDASRTPLREALNRLVAEQLIDFQPGKGFFCRELDPQRVFELYEMREVLESAAVRLACQRGSDEDIAALKDALFANGLAYVGKTIGEVVEFDEAFHMGIAQLAGNAEIARQLASVNERIRFIRWIDMSSRVLNTKGEHKQIMHALEARDADAAEALIRRHIVKRMDQIVAAVKEGYSSIYVSGPEEIFERRVEAGGPS